MNISKSFIKDVAESMAKYGFSAGGSGGGKKCVINTDGNFVVGSFDEICTAFDNSEPIDVYIKSSDQYFSKVICIEKMPDNTLMLEYYRGISYFTMSFDTDGKFTENRWSGDIEHTYS